MKLRDILDPISYCRWLADEDDLTDTDRVDIFIDACKALDQFSQRDQDIFIYYLMGYTQKEIGGAVGLDQSNVSRIIDGISHILGLNFLV